MDPHDIPAIAMQVYERTIRQEILALAFSAIRQGNHIALPGAAGQEVIAVEFTHRSLLIRYKKYHAVNFSLPQPYKGSKIGAEVERRVDELVHPPPSTKLVDHCMAELLVDCLVNNKKYKWVDLHTKALRSIWLRRDEWESWEKEMSRKSETDEYSDALNQVKTKWRNVKKMDHRDRFYQKERDLIAHGSSQILRRQSKKALYWAVDTNDRTIVFHAPEGLQKAYGQQAVKLFKADIDLYFTTNPPSDRDETRHPFHARLLEAHPEFTREVGGFSGVAHIGCWHETGHNGSSAILLETADSSPHAATSRKLLRQIIQGACAYITRAVSMWFGIVEPGLRDEYRSVVRNIDPAVRMDTLGDEVFHLRGFVLNAMTETHVDTSDAHDGLTWTTPLREFEGRCQNILDIFTNADIS